MLYEVITNTRGMIHTEFLLDTLREIAIIVIGVLLALATDQWRKRREEKRREHEFLSGLSEDLKSDMVALA